MPGAMLLKRNAGVAAAAVLLCFGCHDRRQSSSPPVAAKRVSAFDVGAPPDARRLVRGFGAGDGVWRWVERKFAVSLDPPLPSGLPIYFEMEFRVPTETGQTEISVRAGGAELCRKSYPSPGKAWLTCPVPEKSLTLPTLVEVESSTGFRDTESGSERAFIVVSTALKEYLATEEFATVQAGRPSKAMKRVAERWQPVPEETIRDMSRWVFESDAYLNNRFFGVKVAKIPVDLWMMQQILFETRPDYIVETGTWQGGSALYFAWIVQSLGLPTKILTVDIVDVHRTASTHPLWKSHVEFYLGSSTDPQLVKRIADRVRGRKVFVTLDSDHSLLHVARELSLYSPMVHKGGYLVCEDTHLDGVPTYKDLQTGPMAAVEQFLETHPEFERDPTREVAPTYNPGAWLRRK